MAPISKPKRLTIRQDEFCRELILTGNQSEAYRRAFPGSKKWKDDSVHNKASALLRRAQVAARVDQLRSELKSKFDVTAERLLQEQARIAFFDVRRLFKDGKLLDPKDMPDDVASAVSSVKVSQGATGETVVELKLWNKNTALDSLFKNQGLYEKDNKQRGSGAESMSREELERIARGGR